MPEKNQHIDFELLINTLTEKRDSAAEGVREALEFMTQLEKRINSGKAEIEELNKTIKNITGHFLNIKALKAQNDVTDKEAEIKKNKNNVSIGESELEILKEIERIAENDRVNFHTQEALDSVNEFLHKTGNSTEHTQQNYSEQPSGRGTAVAVKKDLRTSIAALNSLGKNYIKQSSVRPIVEEFLKSNRHTGHYYATDRITEEFENLVPDVANNRKAFTSAISSTMYSLLAAQKVIYIYSKGYVNRKKYRWID